ncbi:hypothetical protein Golob_027191 [Gossypium lobatum]|uniref:Uncharacterized protein n=1 Tax=Gossypium lobatum TaxID=34289 RepID=A0A7J8LXG5_9ROSI|nr:hypothetical protein [Gossypium lobatum]
MSVTDNLPADSHPERRVKASFKSIQGYDMEAMEEISWQSSKSAKFIAKLLLSDHNMLLSAEMHLCPGMKIMAFAENVVSMTVKGLRKLAYCNFDAVSWRGSPKGILSRSNPKSDLIV